MKWLRKIKGYADKKNYEIDMIIPFKWITSSFAKI